jgi:plastocyanin
MSFAHGRVPRVRFLLAASVLAASSLFVAACGSGSDAASGTKHDTSTTAAQAGPSVVIDTFMFSPKTVQVKVGDTVTWTNHDDILHTVTSGTREYEPGNSGHVTATHKDGAFDMPMDGKGATGTHTFTAAGTFHYFCDRHPGMEADVEVS